MSVRLPDRLTKASMGSAIILAFTPNVKEVPIYNDCCALRGLNRDWFATWSRQVFLAVDSPEEGKLQEMTVDTVKSFEERLKEDSELAPKLLALCQKVEEFVKKYRK